MLIFQMAKKQLAAGTASDMPRDFPKVFSDTSRYDFVKISYTNPAGEKNHWRVLVKDKETSLYMDYRIGLKKWFYLEEWKGKLAGCTDFTSPAQFAIKLSASKEAAKPERAEFVEAVKKPEQVARKVEAKKPARTPKEKPAKKSQAAHKARAEEEWKPPGFFMQTARDEVDSAFIKSIAGKYSGTKSLPNKLGVSTILRQLSAKSETGSTIFETAKKYCGEYGLDLHTYLPVVLAIMFKESSIVPGKRNHPTDSTYYYGLGQIKPSTANSLRGKDGKRIFNFRDYNEKKGDLLSRRDEAELKSIDKNINGIVNYLKKEIDEHGDLSYALSVYGGDLDGYSEKKGGSPYSRTILKIAEFFKDISIHEMDVTPSRLIIATAGALAQELKAGRH